MYRYGLMALMTAALLVGCEKGRNVELKSDEQKASYAIGQQIGQSLRAEGVKLDPNVIGASIGDAMEGKESRLKPEEMQQAMQAMRQQMVAKQQAAAGENKTKATKFLEENKTKPNVKTTASGLQYEVVTEGTGPVPKGEDQVKVHYKGTLLDGTEFDSSYKRNEPAVFPVGGVIPGWTEALKLMKVGSKYKLWIPPELAYGEQGRPSIPPNSLLVFEVELLDIVKPQATKAQPAAPAVPGTKPAGKKK